MTGTWPLLLLLAGAYDWHQVGDGPEEFRAVARSAVWLLAGLSILAYSAREDPPRRYAFIAVPVLALVTSGYRQVQRKQLHRARRAGRCLLRTLIVGDPPTADRYSRDLNAAPHHGYRIVGACLTGLADLPEPGIPVWGTVSDVPQVARERGIDVVLVVGAQLVGEPLRRLSWALEHVGADLVVAPGLVEVTGARTRMRPAAGLSLIQVESPACAQRRLLPVKSTLDRVMGALFLFLSLPVLVVAVVAVRLSGPGPVLYRQRRMGLHGKPFVLLKLRSMTADADQRRASLLDRSDRDGPVFKMRQDPRVTSAGRVLRRFSLDEVPQLWNVVRGDMALVGPRPPLPEEHAAYVDAVHRRLHVRPGLTGLWQISGRAELSWEESLRLDLRYVDNWSVLLDLQILWKTARAVWRGTGAY